MRRSEGKEPPLRTSILNHSPLVTTETRIKSEMAKKVREKKRNNSFQMNWERLSKVPRGKRREGAFHGEFNERRGSMNSEMHLAKFLIGYLLTCF